MTTTKKSSKDRLVELVEKLVAEDAYEFDGFIWAARPQAFYAQEIGVSKSTVRDLITKAPFVRRARTIGATTTTTGNDVKVEGGDRVTLLRLGDPTKKGPDECARIMRGVWKNKLDREVTEPQKKLLWGFAKDLLELYPGINPVHVFAYAIDHWTHTAYSIKLAMQARQAKDPSFKPQFHDYPCIGTIRLFKEAVIHVYAIYHQEKGGLTKAENDALAYLLDKTDPMNGHPGSTPEIEKAMENGYTIMAAKAAAKLEAEEALEKPSLVVKYGLAA